MPPIPPNLSKTELRNHLDSLTPEFLDIDNKPARGETIPELDRRLIGKLYRLKRHAQFIRETYFGEPALLS